MTMHIQFSEDDLELLVARVVDEVLVRASTKQDVAGERLGFTEAEAAEKLGVERHVLRDARRRGELEASKIGKRIIYTPEQLRAYLSRSRWQPD